MQPKLKQYDLVVIGSGPGGQRAAIQAAKLRKSVLVIERMPMIGGACVHVGTIPSKSLRESVYRWSLGSRGVLGKEDSDGPLVLPEITRLLRRKIRVVDAETQVITEQFRRNQIEIVQGEAVFKDVHTIEIKQNATRSEVKGKTIIIATGARPVAPKNIKVDGIRIHDSSSILEIKKLPRKMMVLGGGIIGCEYGAMFTMAGTQVQLVDKRNEILASVDREIVGHLVQQLSALGMEFVLEAEATTLVKKGSKVEVTLSNGMKSVVDVVLVCLGRQGNSETLGLEKIGIQPTERGLIPVNEFFQTSVPHIYAIGDVIGPPALASVSMEQGRMAAAHIYQLEREAMSQLYPYGIYTIPEISTIGKTEEQLCDEGENFVVGRAPYREIARGQIVGDQWGLLKLLVRKKDRKILGVHIVGDNAADLIHIGQAVMALGGDLEFFIRNVFNYPTLAEAYKTAAFNAHNQILGNPTRITPILPQVVAKAKCGEKKKKSPSKAKSKKQNKGSKK